MALVEKWSVRLAMLVATMAVAAGLYFRCFHIGDYPLWLDEAFSAFAADHDLHYLWNVVPKYETHPPFFYSVLHFWCLTFGDSILARRALGLLVGIATIPVIAIGAATLGRMAALDQASRRWLIAVSIALTALHPLLVSMSRQVRPYPVMALVYAVASLAMMRLVECTNRGERPDRRWLVTFFVTQALMLWLHNLGVLFATAMGLALLASVIRREMTITDWVWLVAGEIVVAIVYLPAFLIMLSQAPEWAHSTWLAFEWSTLPSELGLIYVTWNLMARVAGAIAAVAGIVLLVRQAGGGRISAVLLLLGIVPVALSIGISSMMAPVFLDRTLTAAAVPGILLMSVGLSWPGIGRLLATPVALLTLSSAGFIDNFYAHQGPIQDWNRTIAWLAPRLGPQDVIWAYPNEGALPLEYALRDQQRKMPVRQIPAEMPAFNVGGFYPTGSRGTVSMYPAEIAALMDQPSTKAPPTIWLLRLNKKNYDPTDDMLHGLERDRVPAEQFVSDRIEIVGLRRKD
jgi:mannosyltransferase